MKKLHKLFWERVAPGGPDGCWEWLGTRLTFGHGQLKCDKKHYLAHRISYEIHHGSIPKGMLVCHKCDNPPCVNPRHLFAGTHKDNTQDMLRKGRHRLNPPLGMMAAKAKLRDEDIPAIRADVRSQRAIAQSYGVNHKVICDIKLGRAWRHIP